MKIVLPIEKVNGEDLVGSSFGRTEYFMYFDSEKDETTVIDNSAAMLQGGAGIKAAQTVIDMGADIVILPQCGQNAMDLFNAANISVRKSVDRDVLHNIEKCLNNQLEALNEAHPGFHHKK